jgi:hypothetical protein
MGGNLITVGDGIDALDFNPAAIAPIPARELTFSLFDRSHNSTASFFNAPSTSSLSNFAFSSIGLAAPFETVRGHFAVGISYDRIRDYTSSYSFKAVNPTSSFFNTKGFVRDRSNDSYYGNRDFLANYNIAYGLGLTYEVPDSGSYQLATPFTNGGFEQSGSVTQEGGLSALRIGAGIDIAEGVSAGATLNVLMGSYDFSRRFRETDVNGLDTGSESLPPFQLQYAEIEDELHQDQSGASLKLGLLVKREVVRFGLTIETPQVLHINETSARTGYSQFSSTSFEFDNTNDATTNVEEYDITTPLRFGAGISAHVAGLTAAANASYADMSQIRFHSIPASMEFLNDDARDLLRPVLALNFGGEYIIPMTGFSVRAGYGMEPSPYKNDPSTYDTKTISGGLSILLSPSVLLEGSLRHLTYHTSHNLYNDATLQGKNAAANIDDDAVKRDDVSLTFKYRF